MKIKDMSIESYHAHEAISKSGLDQIHKSIFHFLNPKKVDTDFFRIGNAVHDLVLSKDIFDAKYILQPTDIEIRRGKAWDEFKAANEGKTILKPKEYRQVLDMAFSINQSPLAKQIFKEGEAEHSYFSEIDGVQCRARPDFVTKDIVFDLKTTMSPLRDDFKRSIGRFRYHVQAAFYLDVINAAMGTDIQDFCFLAVEKELPYTFGIYMLDQESIDLGRKHYKEDLEKYKRYLENRSVSPCLTGKQIEVIGLPNWHFYEDGQ